MVVIPTIDIIWAAIIGYILGSIPTSLLLVKWLCDGLDIRTVGSGNVGGRNLYRSLKHVGKPDKVAYPWFFFVAVFDIAKGYLAMLLSQFLSFSTQFGQSDPWVICFAAVFAVLGHNWPIWLLGPGGRGVASSLGIITFFNPLFLLIWLLSFVIVGSIVMYSAITYLLVFIIMGIVLYFWPISWLVSPIANHVDDTTGFGLIAMITLFAMTLVILSRQRANFVKIINGEAKKMKIWKVFIGKFGEAFK